MSDQTTLTVAAIGLAGIVLAAIAGVAGAFLGSWIAARATRAAAVIAQEESRADRTAALEAREADRADGRLDRFAERKLTIAVDLLLAADVHTQDARDHVAGLAEWTRLRREVDDDAAGALEIPPIGSSRPVRSAFLAIELVAPGVAVAAGELYLATVALGRVAARMDDIDDPAPWRRSEDWLAAAERWDALRQEFVDSVRVDLGVNPEVPRT